MGIYAEIARFSCRILSFFGRYHMYTKRGYEAWWIRKTIYLVSPLWGNIWSLGEQKTTSNCSFWFTQPFWLVFSRWVCAFLAGRVVWLHILFFSPRSQSRILHCIRASRAVVHECTSLICHYCECLYVSPCWLYSLCREYRRHRGVCRQSDRT